MDSMDLEREKGITILAKNTAVRYGDVKLNIVDTPGHADFGGEVERGLTMVDGVLLLVDASEGPLPQTRFVLRKALEAHLPVILVINKVDRPDARIAEVVDEVYELFLDLDADEHQIEFPIVYTNAKAGWASLEEGVEGTDLRPLLDLLVEHDPGARPTSPATRCRRSSPTSTPRPTSAGSRSAACATARSAAARQIAWCRADGTIERARVTELYVTEALDRVDADEAGPGEIIAVAGLPDVTIGETLADPDDPRPLPVIRVDEPSHLDDDRHQHLAAGRPRGQQAHRAPAQEPARPGAGRQRLAARAARPSAPTPGRSRAAASSSSRCSSRLMRREGFELTVGKPQVVDARDRRQAPRAGRAPDDRRARGLPRRRHPAARAAQGPHGAHGQPRHRLGAAWSTWSPRAA